MLKSIQIKSYVLIKSLDIDFRQGFSVLTGQTGAGKSIILGALNLLMGQRAESRVIAEGAEKCTVEGHFDISGFGLESLFENNGLDYDEHDTIFRREVSISGKSRAFINDTPVSLSLLKEIGGHLIDIHSQHQNLLLGTEAFQTSVIDTVAGNETLLSQYRNAYTQYSRQSTRLAGLRKESEECIREQEYLQFQYDELDMAHLSEGEQQELEEEQDVLSHAEEIKECLYQVCEHLEGDSGAIPVLRQALQSMRGAARNLPAAEQLADRMDSCLIEMRDICSEASRYGEATTFNPERLDAITDRLDQLYSLMKKHRCDTIESLIEYASSIKGRLDRMGSYQEEISALESDVCKSLKEAAALADKLTKSRKKAAGDMEKRIIPMLIPLGIPSARISVQVTQKERLDVNGADQTEFLFSANQGSALQELASVASGGELSRVMLAIKSMMAGARNLPVIIFDEIDTGVSGAVAERMAIMMRDMCAEGRQVIAISHLPQIAAKSDAHYLVYKEEGDDATHTYIRELNKEQRITEIARMMSGATITEAALENARTLMRE